jgi:hypothetical protein
MHQNLAVVLTFSAILLSAVGASQSAGTGWLTQAGAVARNLSSSSSICLANPRADSFGS